MSEKRKLAVFTIVQNEPYFLPVHLQLHQEYLQ